jgi:hypothetical protein
MADITVLTRLIAGIHRDVDLQQNSLVVGSLKVGSTSPVELTKAILERLIALQNGTDVDATYHTHDGRYFTETELGATSGTSGAQRIGVKGTPVNHTPATPDAQAYFDSIDAALASAGGTAFSDADWSIYNDADPTKVLVFDASGITAGQTRSILMADADVDLSDVNQALLQDGSRPLLANLDFNGFQSANLATATLPGQAVEYTQFVNALTGLDFQRDIDAYVADGAVQFPGTGLPAASTGQRYIIADVSALDVAWGTITGVGNNDIVQYNGTSWFVAYDVSVQGEGALVWNKATNYYMRWDGSSWDEFGGLAGVTAGNGLEKVGNVLNLNFNEMSAVAIASSDELAFGDVSDSNIVKKITFANLNSSLDHNALTNYSANEHINHSTVNITTAAGSGLAGGGDITASRTLTVDITGQTSKTTPAPADEIMIWSVADSARRKISISDLNKNVKDIEEFVAGESFAADTTFAVRIAISGETAGRVYKADLDASSTNKFYVIGVVQLAAPAVAGDLIPVIIKGKVTLAANDTAFSAGEIGEPVQVKAAGAWDAISQITYTSNQASFRFAYVQTTSVMYLDGSKQLNGIA